jgi:cell wall assembly regulator SMI1
MRAHARPFGSVLAPGATPEELAATEAALKVALPGSLRAFLAEFNGMELTSFPSTIEGHPERLVVYNLDKLVRVSNEMYELLCSEDYAGYVSDVKPTYCLVPGGYLRGEIVLRMDESSADAGVEPPVRECLAAYHDHGRRIAKSFEDWLLRSLASMAETSGGFKYLAPTPMW